MATGETITAFKSSTQNKSTAVAGSPRTLLLDSDLQLTLAPNTTYLFESLIRSISATKASGAPPRFLWQFPGIPARGMYSGFSTAFDSADTSNSFYVDTQLVGSPTGTMKSFTGSPANYVVEGPTTGHNMHKFVGLVTTGGSPGSPATFGLQWAATDTGTSQLYVGSWIKMTEV